ncbi:MAG: hypothetical protein Q4A58_02490 [Fusobacterium sp.]|uniref:hypothetical protein n=1 Tax=Fusobacterium sp. TaxID=68766 RepID=UPI0026DB8EA3|nr:hypothetical protein [Fusobacterium sp.]MDO4690146.1 hypothetical protein [Fusobacterium sp.]
MGRKGYSTSEKQVAANKRNLEKNPIARVKQRKFNAKSQAKKYILELADKDELKEVQEWIDSRK